MSQALAWNLKINLNKLKCIQSAKNVESYDKLLPGIETDLNFRYFFRGFKHWGYLLDKFMPRIKADFQFGHRDKTLLEDGELFSWIIDRACHPLIIDMDFPQVFPFSRSDPHPQLSILNSHDH